MSTQITRSNGIADLAAYRRRHNKRESPSFLSKGGALSIGALLLLTVFAFVTMNNLIGGAEVTDHAGIVKLGGTLDGAPMPTQ